MQSLKLLGSNTAEALATGAIFTGADVFLKRELNGLALKRFVSSSGSQLVSCSVTDMLLPLIHSYLAGDRQAVKVYLNPVVSDGLFLLADRFIGGDERSWMMKFFTPSWLGSSS